MYTTVERYFGDPSGSCDEIHVHPTRQAAVKSAIRLSLEKADKGWVDLQCGGITVAQAKEGEVRTPQGEEFV